MDLFVVNRYQGDHELTQEDEKEKLNLLLQKIKKNKKRQRKKEKYIAKSEVIAKTTMKRQLKREAKAQMVSVPENNIDEFVDTPIESNMTEEVKDADVGVSKNKKRKRKNVPPTDETNPEQSFTVLGNVNNIKKQKVKRVLPKWLSEPTVISTNLSDLQTKVSSMKLLDKDLRKKLKANGVKYFFPVQAEVIPWLLKANSDSSVLFPRDICVSAPTGSGKTLAFALPVIQALKRHLVKKIRALVVLPTQDLALQVFKTFKAYCENTNVDVCFITGKNAFSVEQKMLIAENVAFGCMSKADIVVCTAGRLVDHLKHTNSFDLKDLEYLIIDEADSVLENVQHDWLYHLNQEDSGQHAMKVLNLFNLQKKKPPQKLLFSATLSQDPEKLEKLSLFQPKLFTSIVEESNLTTDQKVSDTFIGKFTTPKELSEKYIVCSLDIKPLILYKYIKTQNLTRTLIFTNSINEAHRLCILLRGLFENKLRIEEISSHLDSKNRKELIREFSKGVIDLIICTDTLARGIDLPDVQCVISYSAPKHLKTYIHRAGRTARAGCLGTAVTLLHTTQVVRFKSLLQQAQKNNVEEVELPGDDLESLEKTYEVALEELKKTVNKEEEDDLNKMKRTKRTNPRNSKRKRTNSNN